MIFLAAAFISGAAVLLAPIRSTVIFFLLLLILLLFFYRPLAVTDIFAAEASIAGFGYYSVDGASI